MHNPDQRPSPQQLDALRTAFPAEWGDGPAGAEAVEAWERANDVRLPEPYRTFVAEVANGCGLGPPDDGGLLPLGWLPPDWPDDYARDPAVPFLLADAWRWEDGEPAPSPGLRPEETFNHGSIVLGQESDQSTWLLIVTGPQRGRIWLVSEVGAYPYPLDGAFGFADWVDHWHGGTAWWD